MALTHQQDIPEKPRPAEGWTFTRLFPLAATVSTLTKTFANPFDVLLGYLVVMAGVCELLGRRVSWFYWGFTILILGATIYVRHFAPKEEKKAPKK